MPFPSGEKEIAVLKIIALFNKGIILKQDGKYDDALKYFKTAFRRSSRLKLLPQMVIIQGILPDSILLKQNIKRLFMGKKDTKRCRNPEFKNYLSFK